MKFLLSSLVLMSVLWTQFAAAQTFTRFQHVVVIVQENRTPDNLFQGLCAPPFGNRASCSTSPTSSQYNIQTGRWVDQNSPTGVVHPTPVQLDNDYDLDHSHMAFAKMCDAGANGACRMDGAAGVTCWGHCPEDPQFKFVSNSSGILNPYLSLAVQYGWANYMFQTNQGPSFPAHQFIFGGTSAPTAADDEAGIFASENVVGGNGTAGCIAGPGATVELIGPLGDVEAVYPCFEHQTIPDLLPTALSWRYYTPQAGSIWTAPNAIQHICRSTGAGGQCIGREWTNNIDLKPADVLLDIANCRLRSVSWVIPNGRNSDHASTTEATGPSWVASILNAIGNSTQCDGNSGYWNDTAIFITWDDWGGWYDHVPPPILPSPQGSYQYGLRVPLIVVSAYTPPAYIDSQPQDFGSLLSFIEQNFGILQGALNFADARAQGSLTDFFDPNLSPRPYTTIPAPLTAKFFINDTRNPTDPDDD
jgi:phospholipase C